MLHKSHKFIYHFLILFLAILLAMFGMYYGLAKYQDYLDRVNPGTALDVDRLFKVNLFVIDLCVLVIAETLMILLFYKYTLPSIGIASVMMIALVSLKDFSISNELITSVFSPFIENKYAFLGTSDVVMLIILNTLILTFMITVLLKEAEVTAPGIGKRPMTISHPEKAKGEEKQEGEG